VCLGFMRRLRGRLGCCEWAMGRGRYVDRLVRSVWGCGGLTSRTGGGANS